MCAIHLLQYGNNVVINTMGAAALILNTDSSFYG